MRTERFSKYKIGEGFLGQQKGRGKPPSTENMRKGSMYVRGCFALLFLILLLSVTCPLPPSKKKPQGKLKEAFKIHDLVQREENLVPFALTDFFILLYVYI